MFELLIFISILEFVYFFILDLRGQLDDLITGAMLIGLVFSLDAQIDLNNERDY